ncbi:fibronectin type III domain-containing protein [Rhodopila sp.]|uniref:fibronectin type III domain-containing protein n=1 Tax=Rhodopila sp. TaxID=2480087 RepID=UPI003D09A17C
MPISQGGSLCAVSVGALLASAQPAISIQSSALLGRTSLGSGGPEQIDVGIGLTLSGGTVVATGADHAAYPSTSSFVLKSDLVISSQGSQMLMPTEFLRELFSAGQNVTIDGNGVISSVTGGASISPVLLGSAIGALEVISSLAVGDLIPISQSGADHAIKYADFLNGLTIDQAPSALPASNSDRLWVAQDANTMGSQSFGAIWAWISSQMPGYTIPVAEITVSVGLNAIGHNGRILVCSQPVTLTPLPAQMGDGFQCQVINVSSGNVTLGSGVLTSSGGNIIGPQQSAVVQCFTYSAGTVVYALMSQASVAVAIPGQVTGLVASSVSATAVTLSWQTPLIGGYPSNYLVFYRQTGSSGWIDSPSAITGTSSQLANLQAGTSYDFQVQAVNGSGTGIASQSLTASTTTVSALPLQVPAQVTGLAALTASSTSVQLSWSGQTGSNAAATYSIQYRITGSTSWTSSVSGIAGSSYGVTGLQASTGYDFSIFGVNTGGAGLASVVVSVTTPAAQLLVPGQVSNFVASVTSSIAILLSWSTQTGPNASTSYTVQYRMTGSAAWTSSIAGIVAVNYNVTGLQPSTSYDFLVFGVNTIGVGPSSSVTSAATEAIGTPVSSVTWNLGPSGPYTRGNGTVALNAFISPASAPVQFGLSTSTTIEPTSWTVGQSINNTALWGAYVPTPAIAGRWYAWVEGTDGSSPAVFAASFIVQ